MRSEQEILDLILSTARNDNRIRAVMMNGSRANPNAPRDFFQDFDIIYFVTEVNSFTNDHAWINCFGELMILQMPEAMQDSPPQDSGRFSYLMQFMDGNRIDLNLFPVTKLKHLGNDSLRLVLLDKDGLFDPLAPPSEKDYLPLPPTAKAFADCCNEFWWVSSYVAKGLWRKEITYAKYMFDQGVRGQLMKMLNWYVGVRTGFSRNPGKFGKYLQNYLEPELWELLQKTYSDAGYDTTWEALDAMCALFRFTAIRVAAHFGLEYPHGDDQRVSAHLHHVRFLPGDARELY